MTVPTGNGESRGLESAPGAGQPLPSRPARARANDARHADFLGIGDPKDQAGFGTEDMSHDAHFIGRDGGFPSEDPPDLSAMGSAGQPFGGS